MYWAPCLNTPESDLMPARGSEGYNRLYIKPLLDPVLKNFKSHYIPGQNISIDESMISFKGRLSWVQYLPKKNTKWGMKAWVLADSANAYVWSWKLYTGKEGSDTPTTNLAHRVVLELIKGLEEKGYNSLGSRPSPLCAF